MITRIIIDPNVRVAHNRTFVGFEDIETGEPVEAGMRVYVVEPETNLVGKAVVHEVDEERRLIYLDVDWASLTEPSADDLLLQEGGANISINQSTLTRPSAQDALRVGSSSEFISELSR